MGDARLAIIISAMDHATRELKQVRDEVDGLGKAGKEAGKGGLQWLKDGFHQAQGAALKVYATLKMVKEAIDKVYQASKEGAELQYLQQRFENLSESIGTTSAALMRDLRAAMRGTKSDAELMSGAVDLMSMGLVKNHDEAVRLSAVAGALNWDMNVLTLTISNLSMMRLDNLGLSVDKVKPKFVALKAQGLEPTLAMTRALIEAGEERMRIEGHVADTTLGSYAKMEAAQANYFNTLKQNLADGGSQWAEFWTKAYEGMTEGLNRDKLVNELRAMFPGAKAVVEEGIEDILSTSEKSFSEVYAMYSAGSANIGFAIAEGVKVKESWDKLLDRPGAEDVMRTILGQFQKLNEHQQAFHNEHIDWEKYLRNPIYRDEIDAMIQKSVEWNESIKTTGKHYDDYEDQQQAVVEQFKAMREAGQLAIEKHLEMESVLQDITGTTGRASTAMTQWLDSQSGINTFISLAKTYTVELKNIAEKKEKIVQLQEIVKNQGGVFEGTKISAKEASEQIEKLNGEISDAEARMISLAKNAVIEFMIKSIVEDDALSNAEKLQKTIDLLKASGDVSDEAIKKLGVDLGDLFKAYGGENELIVKAITELDSSNVDNWQPPTKFLPVGPQLNTKPVDDWQPTPVMQWVISELNNSEVDNWQPPKKRLEVEAQLNKGDIDSWEPASKTMNVYTNLVNNTQQRMATGGAVHAASGSVTNRSGNYIWQEYGYRGEVFVPSLDGYILSKADASRALSAGNQNMDMAQLGSAMENAFMNALDRFENKLRPSRPHEQAGAFENIARWR